MIRTALQQELELADGRVLAISGAASGGDILFQEACAELSIPASIYLARPRLDYARESVQDSGPAWVERFTGSVTGRTCTCSRTTTACPRWLRQMRGYTILERSTHWILHNASALAESVTTIALWDGCRPDGPGGTYDIIQIASQRGFKVVHLDATELLRSDG